MNSSKRNQTTLRIPKELDEKLTNKAKELGVSKNAYILMLITNFYDKPLFNKETELIQKEVVWWTI